MKTDFITLLRSQPGIQRDGTVCNARAHIDGQWTRFFENLPYKIGGYKIIGSGNQTIIRSMFSVPQLTSHVDIYFGRSDSVTYVRYDENGNGESEVNRTPNEYVADENNSWVFDTFTEDDGEGTYSNLIFGQVCPNADDIYNDIEGPIYYGNTDGLNANSPLTQVLDDGGDPLLCSGGIINYSPIMIAYGNNGLLRWSIPGQPNAWPKANFQVISNEKIIKMALFRGQLLAWTPTTLIALNYIPAVEGPPAVRDSFSVTVIRTNITVLSPNSIIGYNQQYYWPGSKGQFYQYNGLCTDLPNTMSTNWFYNNINLTMRSKCWAIVIDKFNEVWFHYPKGDEIECSDAVMICIQKDQPQFWFDSQIARGAGISTGSFPYPIMSDNTPVPIPTRLGPVETYPIWMHEFGYDKVINSNTVYSIDSYFQTHFFRLFDQDPNNNLGMRVTSVHNDFNESGDLSLSVQAKMYPSDTVANGRLAQKGPFTFNLNTKKIDGINIQGFFVSFIIQSNVLGGSFQAGSSYFTYKPGDGQR